MEIALIVLALLSAGFLVAVWRLVRRADDPAASHAVVEAIACRRELAVQDLEARRARRQRGRGAPAGGRILQP